MSISGKIPTTGRAGRSLQRGRTCPPPTLVPRGSGSGEPPTRRGSPCRWHLHGDKTVWRRWWEATQGARGQPRGCCVLVSAPRPCVNKCPSHGRLMPRSPSFHAFFVGDLLSKMQRVDVPSSVPTRKRLPCAFRENDVCRTSCAQA